MNGGTDVGDVRCARVIRRQMWWLISPARQSPLAVQEVLFHIHVSGKARAPGHLAVEMINNESKKMSSVRGWLKHTARFRKLPVGVDQK